LIFVDEALYAEIASDAQILKTMTSETTKLLERKGIDSIQIDNFSRLVFATNEEHPIQIEHDDRRYPAIYVKENESFANEPDPIAKAKKRKVYFARIIDQLDNGGAAALLGFLLDRDVGNFNAEAIPETAERKQQKLQSASAGDQVIIEFAQAGCLPGALGDRPWIARPHGDPERPRKDQTPGLLDEMRARGGQKISRLSDHKLTDILKAWNFKPKHLGYTRGWEAPLLPELRAAILAKYPATDFDDRTEWNVDKDDYSARDAAAVRDTVAKETDARQAAVQDAVARHTTAGQVEVRALAGRQVAALETAKQQKAAREAAEREATAKAEAAVPEAIRQLFAARTAANGSEPPKSG
jgi:Family of unknown function (DUF5906)